MSTTEEQVKVNEVEESTADFSKLEQLITLALNQAGVVSRDIESSSPGQSPSSSDHLSEPTDLPSTNSIVSAPDTNHTSDSGHASSSGCPSSQTSITDENSNLAEPPPDSVLPFIMNHLSFEDLANCAQISKSWYLAATQKLQTWQLIKLRIYFLHSSTPPEESKLAIKMSPEGEPDRPCRFYKNITYEVLQAKLNSPPKRKKVIWLILDLSPVLQRHFLWICVKLLFDLIRPYVTRLILDGSLLKMPGSEMKSANYFLLDSPQLRHLTFREILMAIPESHMCSKLSLPPYPLLKVKSLRFHNVYLGPQYQSVISRIVSTLPNVVQFHNYPLHSVYLLTMGDTRRDEEALKRIKSISYELRLNPDGEPSPELGIMAILKPYLSLHTLVTSWSDQNRLIRMSDLKRCHENFSAIIANSRHTLRTLEIHNTTFAQYLEIPDLPALRTLILVAQQKNGIKYFRYFGKGFNFTQKFPNLVRLVIVNVHKTTSHLDALLPSDIFPPIWPGMTLAPSLRQLKIRDYMGVSNEMLIQLSIQFPQIQVLDIGQSWQWIVECSPAIWTLWPGLTELTMEIRWSGDAPVRCLDEIFTGIPEAKCKVLRSFPDKVDVSDLAECRSKPSIANLKSLKKLNLCFLSTTVHLLSHVSVFYGFNLVPELEVLLTYPSTLDQDKGKENEPQKVMAKDVPS